MLKKYDLKNKITFFSAKRNVRFSYVTFAVAEFFSVENALFKRTFEK